MRTVVLSTELPEGFGGRPMQVGRLDCDTTSGRLGVFVGYDRAGGHKVSIPLESFQKLVSKQGYEVITRVEVKALKGSNIALGRVIAGLIPKSIKNYIVQQSPSS